VEDAAHARQLFAHYERDGRHAAHGCDELKVEQARIMNLPESVAQSREFFGGELLAAYGSFVVQEL
jgi:hypothetical protein